jgi:tRNA pseudouridine38-40 synthase
VTLFDELSDELSDDDTAALTGPLCRVRMLVAYDGGPFRGFARQPNVKTVAGTMAEAAGKVLGHRVVLTCAGRTDAGVHAWGQVVHFDTNRTGEDLDLPGLQRSLNKMLHPYVVIRAIDEAPDSFDARHSATGRRYRYTVLRRDVPDPFLARYAWHVEHELDLRAMQLGCDPLFGEHDFSSFCRRPPDNGTLVRRVTDAEWSDLGDGVWRFEIAAKAFCHQMVRSIVGTLIEVGMGRKRAGDVAAIMRSGDRRRAGQPAPPHGLCLWEVTYGT